MSDTTKIEWANHTGGPHFGCSPVSPGCANCYAWELAESRLENLFRRAYKNAGFTDWDTRPVWGDKATRVLSKGFWVDAVRINKMHAARGTRGRWFPSMIDWLDDMPGGIIDLDGKQLDPLVVLAKFLKLIHDTPHLDWLLLTKRPDNFKSRVEKASLSLFKKEDDAFNEMLVRWTLLGTPPSNVWIGTSVEDQTRADQRIPALLKIPARVRFLSAEPLLGPLNIKDAMRCDVPIHWTIVGGESGPNARPCNVEWIRSIVRQCKAAGVPVFCKQLGAKPSGSFYAPEDRSTKDSFHDCQKLKEEGHFKDSKGGEPSEWPEDLRVREYPAVLRPMSQSAK